LSFFRKGDDRLFRVSAKGVEYLFGWKPLIMTAKALLQLLQQTGDISMGATLSNNDNYRRRKRALILLKVLVEFARNLKRSLRARNGLYKDKEKSLNR